MVHANHTTLAFDISSIYVKLFIRLYFGRHGLFNLHFIPINLLSKFHVVLKLELVVNLLLI